MSASAGRSRASETLAGEIARAHQDKKQRYVMMDVTSEVPGIVLVGIWDMGETNTLSVCRFFYGSDAGT